MFPFYGSAQSITDSLIDEMYMMWEKSYSHYEIDHMEGELSDALEYFVIHDSLKLTSEELRSEILKANSDLVKKNWGLDWSAGYIYNTAPGMEVADNILYKSRVQTQVSWDLLNNGFVENRTRGEILFNESEISRLAIENDLFRGQDIIDNWHHVIYSFNKQKIAVLDDRLALAEKRVAISYQLKSLGMITHEELLNNLESYAEISSLYKIYQDYNSQLNLADGNFETKSLPLIDLNYQYGIDQLEMSPNDSIQNLLIRNLELENKFYNDIDLKLYSRYNYYNLINSPIDNRAFLTIGIGVGIPIAFDKKEKEKLYELQKKQIQNGEQEVSADDLKVKNDVLGYFYEFRYKLKQFNAFYYKKLKLEEMLKKEQARYEVNRLDFNPLKALRWLDESMSVDIELIDLKQQLYLYVLRIQSVSSNHDLNQLIVPVQLEDLEIEKVKRKPSQVYIWSKTINGHSADFLVNYCLIHNISKVVVSSASNKEKLNEFVEKCSENSISVDLMIGNNHLIESTDVSLSLDNSITGIDMSFVSGLHLDVEPQTFEDWKDKEEAYTEQYIDMYKKAQVWCNAQNVELSVSLPTYFSSSTVNEIQKLNGTIYFMCYENVSTSFLQKKLEVYKGSIFNIALRPEDFKNMAEVDQKIDELHMLLEPKEFIIHDLERLLKFNP